ncbi:RagB/SusD family nutrient uptake outer membrane protein, partial [Corynebacterium diphtheriae]|uniref:RagB/SusD family nutrient uptake outer membrane protein n=1 Tax=Corynebacterium diphtheriae TaxID=1717 RepID=UPI001C628A12
MDETYLIAAEAAYFLGKLPEAVGYFIVIRERAAYPPGNPVAMELTDAKLAQDFILDERSRELCGQMVRYFDLARTGQLANRIILH